MASLLDGEDILALESASTWDESAWSTDRSGQATEGDSDRNLHPLASSTAPTRGPSPAGSFRRPGTKAEEDEDFARAMAASQGDIRYGNQETGVMRPDGSTIKVQGPQLPGYENPNQWALVRVEQTTSEVVPDVDPVGRRHIPGQPRFLKNSIHGDYLPSFLTICHNIPAVRELLLMPGYTRYDYGQNPEWWKGHPIVLPKVVHTSDGSPADPVLARYDDFVAELQRLMAFLDASERAYASTANLEKTAGLARHGKSARTSTQSIVETFITELIAAAHSVNQSADIVEQIFGLQAGSADGSIDSRMTTLLDFAVEGETHLSEQMDRILWDTEAIEEEPVDRYVESLPAVMVMRLKQHSPTLGKLGVTAPSHLYMDKYLKENVDAIRPLRNQMSKERGRLSKISTVGEKLKNWRSSRYNITVDTEKLLAQTKAQIKPGGPDTDMANGSIVTETDRLSDQIDTVMRSIEEKLILLDQERNKTLKALSDLSSPSHAESLLGGLEHRFTLVGIATKPTTTYVLLPKEDTTDEQMITDDQSDEETPPTMQWWRIEYSLNGTKAAINRNTTFGYETLPAIELEHTSALLVYASDAALDQRLVSDRNLPDALQEFVRADNAFFEEELQSQPPPSYQFDEPLPTQTIERKISIDSTRAEGGSDAEMDQDPRTHASYGLGYDVQTQYDDQPLVEITPDGPGSSDSGADVSHDNKVGKSWDDSRPRDESVQW